MSKERYSCMIKFKRHIIGIVSIIFALSSGACANSDIVVRDSSMNKEVDEPVFETQKNNQKFYDQLIDCEKTKAILSLITRISFIDNFNKAKTQYQNIDINFYRPKYQYLNIIQKIILSLMLNKHYLTLFIITKFRTSIGKIRNKGERFIEL